MRSRKDHVVREAVMCDTDWKRNLLERVGRNLDPEAAHDVIRRVALYRDRWCLGDSPLPLGPVPATHEWERREQHAYIGLVIDQADHPPASQSHDPAWAGDAVTLEDRLTNVGWQL
jgi:hypothetical protein